MKQIVFLLITAFFSVELAGSTDIGISPIGEISYNGSSGLSLLSDRTRVRGAVGEVPVVGVTPEQARIAALEAAKTEALRMANVEQEIKSTQAIHVTSTEQLLSSFSTIELRGAVVEYDVVREDLLTQRDGLMYCRVVINAVVQKYRTKADPEFTLEIRGLSESGYRQGQRITFEVMPHGDGYLHLFMVDPLRVVDRVFPSDLELERRFAADSAVLFPTTATVVYTASKGTQDKMESNFLIVVMTKQNVKFKQDVTLDNLMGWVNSLEPDQRVVAVENILITK